MDPKGIISHCWFVIWTFEHLSNLLKWSVYGLICVSFAILSTTVRDVYKTSYFYGLIITFCSYSRVVTLACYMKCNLFKTKLQKLNQTHFMYVSLKLIASWIFRFICSSYAWLCVYLCFVEWVGWSIMLFFVSFTNFSFLYFSTSSNQSTCMLETFSVWFSFGVLFVGLDRVHVS